MRRLLGAREIEEVCALGLIELKRSRDRLQNLLGNTRGVTALKARVVVDAHSSKERDLLAAETRDAARAVPESGHSCLLRRDPCAPCRQELADLFLGVHEGTVAL